MSGKFLDTTKLPFCKGCGHHIVAGNIEKALSNMEGYNTNDVIIVTDIGCIGIIDRKFHTHTVHGLHGRSAALGAGISLGLNNPKKKVIVLIGDGGSTIGLQHLVEAAHRNVNMTVIVHNNMLYGMTGGQPSGMTPCGFKTPITPAGKADAGYDLRGLMHSVGAPYSRRLIALGDFSNELEEAFKIKGFSFVEAIEICPSYGIKFNPRRNINDIASEAGLETGLLKNESAVPFEPKTRLGLPSLLNAVSPIEVKNNAGLERKYSLYLSGSAGEGVQSAAEYLAQAAMSCGLFVTKKGSYPVTVGVGFSTSEVIISPEKIMYTGIPTPDAVIVNSIDGLGKVRTVIESMNEGKLYLDNSLEAPETEAEIIRHDYRESMGTRNCSLMATMHFLKHSGVIPLEAFTDTLKNSKLGAKLDLDKMLSLI